MKTNIIVHEWCVIDPKLDRPCFSSTPPVTLRKDPEIVVVRFDRIEEETIDVDTVENVHSKEEARSRAKELFEETLKLYKVRQATL